MFKDYMQLFESLEDYFVLSIDERVNLRAQWAVESFIWGKDIW